MDGEHGRWRKSSSTYTWVAVVAWQGLHAAEELDKLWICGGRKEEGVIS
jgi:hypothetical protein